MVDIAIVGGCGRVGLPLGLAFGSRGQRVALYDINERAVATVNAGTMPFDEPGAADMLRSLTASGDVVATSDVSAITRAENVVIVIGTPVDEHLNPDLNAVPGAVTELASH